MIFVENAKGPLLVLYDFLSGIEDKNLIKDIPNVFHPFDDFNLVFWLSHLV